MMLLFLLAGCVTELPTADCDLDGAHLVVATVDRRFTAGALMAVHVESGCTTALPSVDVGADPIVRTVGEHVAVVNRAGPRNLTLYRHGAYDQPAAQVGLEPGRNVHDVAWVNDRMVLTPYDDTHLSVRDQNGGELGTIDLAPLADSDGLPEPDRIVVRDGVPAVVLQRLTRDTDGWRADESGVLVEFDLATLEPGVAEPVGPNPRLASGSGDERVWLTTGLFGEADGDLRSATGRVVADESTLGYDLGHAAVVGDHAVVLGTSFGWEPVTSELACVDLRDGTVERGASGQTWWIDAVAVPDRGIVYAAARGFGDAAEQVGVVEVDPVTCQTRPVGGPWLLDPYGLAWVSPTTLAAARIGW